GRTGAVPPRRDRPPRPRGERRPASGRHRPGRPLLRRAPAGANPGPRRRRPPRRDQPRRVVGVAMTTLSASPLTGTYALHPGHSSIGFVARHAMITKVRGVFSEFHGTITVDAEDPSRSTARVTIAAASLDTRNSGRDAHLRSGDFF